MLTTALETLEQSEPVPTTDIPSREPGLGEVSIPAPHPLAVRRFGDLVLIRGPRAVTAFHTGLLEVAQTPDEAWQAAFGESGRETASFGKMNGEMKVKSSSLGLLQEIREELSAWSASKSSSAVDVDAGREIRSITINVAQVCNLGCTYCAAGGDGTYGERVKAIDLSSTERQIRHLMSSVRPGETFRITFLGGEPLVVPNVIRSLVRFARLEAAGRSIQLRFDMVTNGTLITPEIAEMLADMQCHLSISIDGPPEINDRNRPTKGGTGSTYLTLRGIEHLRPVRERLGRLTAAAVFGTHNTDVLATWSYLRELPVDSIKFDFAAEIGDQDASRAYALSLCEVAERAYALGGEKELRRLSIFDTFFRILDNQTRIQSHCGAGKDHLQIDAKGRFSACQWFVGQPEEDLGSGISIDEARRAELFGDALVEKNNCQTCWARFVCGGGCMFAHKTKTGSRNRVDSDYCERQRMSIAKGIELYGQSRIS
jgi:uncharacterized protein